MSDILVVDDDRATLVAIEAALHEFRGHLFLAQSANEAFGHLLSHDFALILLDVKMPSMDGFEAARMIRSRERSRHIPIIFTTAYGHDDREILAAYELGAVDFLFKPLKAEVLRAKVSFFVELNRRTAKLALQSTLLREHERREHERTLEFERRRWEADSLRRQMQELEGADRRKDDFLAQLGHELRNPLTPLVAGLEIVRRKVSAGPTTDPGVLRVCETMQKQAKHLTRLVDDLLDISRITSGRIELRMSVVSIEEIVNHALTDSRPLIERKHHHVFVDVPARPLLVRGDAARLVQIVANLVNNAARYTDPGGSIRIECKDAGDWTEVSVVDNGRGIAPEFLPRVFDRFAQEQGASKDGLGLGLTLSSQLVELHGGTIAAFSDGPGRGSRFVVRLRTEKNASVPPQRDPAHAPADMVQSKPLVIALIEDEEDIRELMQELLEMSGHAVKVADDGESGVELITRLRPDIAFVDIGLPDIDGYDVATRVRNTLGTDTPRLVAMTGFGQASDRKSAKKAGFDVHLVKPVDVDTLMNALSF